MNNEPNGPRNKEDNTKSTFETRPDVTPRREGGDDALAEKDPTNSRLDEKVIVNEQRSDKIVNSPAQAATNDSESTGNDEEIVNR